MVFTNVINGFEFDSENIIVLYGRVILFLWSHLDRIMTNLTAFMEC